MWVGLGGVVVVMGTRLSDQILTCLVLRIIGIKLQLLCVARIEPTQVVGLFFPFPGFPGRGVTINTSPRNETKSLTTGYPHSQTSQY